MIEINLTDDEKNLSKELGISYSTYLHENRADAVIVLQIYHDKECIFEETYSCLSFAGYHDLDAWDNALEQARLDYLSVIKDSEALSHKENA